MPRRKFGTFAGGISVGLNTIDQLIGGYFTGEEIILAGGTTSVLRSQGFIPGSAGLALFGDGSAEFYNVIIRGSVTATSGAIGGFTLGADYIRDAADSFGLSSTVTGGDDVRFWAGNTFANRATAPYRLTEAGALFATSVDVLGNMTLTGAGMFQTVASGSYPRTEIQAQQATRMRMEISATREAVISTGATPLRLEFFGPFDGVTPASYISLFEDDIKFWAGGVEMLRLTESTNDQVFIGPTGFSGAPALSWIGDTDTGFAQVTAGTLGLINAGVEQIRLDQSQTAIFLGLTAYNPVAKTGTKPATPYTTPDLVANTDGDTGMWWGGLDGATANYMGMSAGGTAYLAAVGGTGLYYYNAPSTASAYNTLVRNSATGIVYYNTSDVRTKTNITTVLSDDKMPDVVPKKKRGKRPSVYNPVLDLTPILFDSIPDTERGRALPFWGLVAQEVEEKMPEAFVTGGVDDLGVEGYANWDERQVLAALLAEVKSLRREVDQLRRAA